MIRRLLAPIGWLLAAGAYILVTLAAEVRYLRDRRRGGNPDYD